MKTLLTVLAAAVCAVTAQAQVTFNELEPNTNKAEANPVLGMTAGDNITGTTTGTSTVALSTALTSVDQFRIKTAPLPLGIYRHELLITSSPVGHTGSLRGRSQTGGIINVTSDITFQNSSTLTTPQRFNAWYGFGKQEELYYRVAGTATTTAPYVSTMSTSTVTPVVVPGSVFPGPVTLNWTGQTTTDTDMWVYDSNLDAIVGGGNDDEFMGPTLQSRLTITLAAGTYYVVVSTFETGNNLPSVNDDYLAGFVTDFPDVVMHSQTTIPLNLNFTISDGITTIPVVATKTLAYEAVWIRFTVAPPAPPSAFCFGTNANCPCGNGGSGTNGCANNGNPAGGNLSTSGTASISADTLVLNGSGMVTVSPCSYFQGTTQGSATFGDGLRCADGTLVRLGQKYNDVLGASSYGGPGDTPIHIKGLVSAGNTRTYQAIHRDANPTFCTPATWNTTNGVSAQWGP